MPAVTPWSTASHAVIDAAGTKARIFLETPDLSANARRENQTYKAQTYVLMVELRKPVDKNARTFLRMTGKKLYRSRSTGAFHALVSRAELKTIFGLTLTVTVAPGAGNSAHTDAAFIGIKGVLTPSLRAFVEGVRIEDDPKFSIIDDAVEFGAR